MRHELPDSGVFPIWSRRRQVPLRDGLVVPAEHLWWFVATEDTVLLSDRVTHHYANVSYIDEAAQTISFGDPWADEFFLQAGRNTLGIEAQGTRITRADFERAAVGLHTWDRLTLFDAYFAAHPEQAATADAQIRVGHLTLGLGSDSLAPQAAVRFARALDSATKAGDQVLRRHAAACLFLAAVCVQSLAQSMRNEPVTRAMNDFVRLAQSVAPAAALVAELQPKELARLAFAALRVKQPRAAIAWCSAALEHDACFEDGYWLRAQAHADLGDATAAMKDVEQFLALNTTAVEDLERRLAATHPDASIDLAQLRHDLAERKDRRQRVLEIQRSLGSAGHASS
jgi:tetratricopeptide (TPR) repeat protein